MGETDGDVQVAQGAEQIVEVYEAPKVGVLLLGGLDGWERRQ